MARQARLHLHGFVYLTVSIWQTQRKRSFKFGTQLKSDRPWCRYGYLACAQRAASFSTATFAQDRFAHTPFANFYIYWPHFSIKTNIMFASSVLQMFGNRSTFVSIQGIRLLHNVMWHRPIPVTVIVTFDRNFRGLSMTHQYHVNGAAYKLIGV